MEENKEIQKQKKAQIDAQVSAFTCLLIYFVIKAIVLLILYKYDNFLKHEHLYIIPFVFLLVMNTYLILTVGKDPGFQTNSFQQNELLQFSRNEHNFCKVCNCRKKNRTKHCYLCGKCVRKFDHHCPWIGACVGQNNHFKFWLLLLTQTLQANLTFYILFQSTEIYEYKHSDGTFSQEYGVFMIFSFLMFLYLGFVGSLLLFHTYLLIMNVTSRELFSRHKCNYLAGVKGNPYFSGIFKNFKEVAFVDRNGREWLIPEKTQSTNKSILSIIWSNEYYSCC